MKISTVSPSKLSIEEEFLPIADDFSNCYCSVCRKYLGAGYSKEPLTRPQRLCTILWEHWKHTVPGAHHIGLPDWDWNKQIAIGKCPCGYTDPLDSP